MKQGFEKSEDISGQKFNMLTAIEPVSKNKCGQTMWKCTCDCGKETIISISSLKTGHIKSCGCLLKKSSERQRYNLTGQKFGKLTVMSYYGRRKEIKSHNNFWVCKCECGNETIVETVSLLSGGTKSCGCLTRNDLTSKIFERLIVLGKDDYWSKKYNCTTYKCQCQCGNIKYVRGTSLVSGSVRSCGCIAKEVEDLVGQKFGELTVLEYVGKKEYSNCGAKINIWKCLCSCGNIIAINQGELKTGFNPSCGCQSCSIGEKIIEEYLKNNNIKYDKQKRFADCRYKNPLPFDFYLPKGKICIEYQGQQHYEPVDFAGKGKEWAKKQLQLNQIRDEIKRTYCKNNGIKLVEISYLEKDNLENLMLKLKKLV